MSRRLRVEQIVARAWAEMMQAKGRRHGFLQSGSWISLSGKAAIVLALSLWLSACASTYTRPLTSRGLPAEERKDYVIQNGYGIPEIVKQSFLDGFVEVGMARELVFQLYGAPDRTTEGDANWEYVNNRGTLITGITFKNDKVEKIYGDPKGGANPEAKGKTGL